jgi:hypothetical protein
MITEVIKGLACAAFLCPAVEVAQEGKYITLRNAKIDMYRGSMRLAVDQWGKVEALEDASFQPKVRAIPISSPQHDETPWPVCLQSKQLSVYAHPTICLP